MKPPSLNRPDVLTRDLSAVPVDCTLLKTTEHEHCGVWCNMNRFQRHLSEEYDFIDVMSYGSSLDALHGRVRRAVIGLGNRTEIRFRQKPEQVKLFTNIHAKVVLGYTDPKEFPSVYVGSHNHVGATLYELMVELEGKQALAIVEFFESFWQDAKKNKHASEGETNKCK